MTSLASTCPALPLQSQDAWKYVHLQPIYTIRLDPIQMLRRSNALFPYSQVFDEAFRAHKVPVHLRRWFLHPHSSFSPTPRKPACTDAPTKHLSNGPLGASSDCSVFNPSIRAFSVSWSYQFFASFFHKKKDIVMTEEPKFGVILLKC